LREGGNAVDAAVCAMLTSFIAESPLTGLGAGGFMLVHTPEGDDHLLDFFVSAPKTIAPADKQVPFVVDFDGALQRFNGGPASCGVYGTAAGIWEALKRFGTVAMSELARPAIQLSRDGVPTTAMHAFLYKVLEPILTHYPECRSIYAPDGHMPREGELLKLPEFGDAIERLAVEGAEPFYVGEIAQKVSDWLLEHGGTITREDLSSYTVEDRAVGEIDYRGHAVITNPPPSSGGVLIAASLKQLAREQGFGVPELVRAMEFANQARDEAFVTGLAEPGFFDHFLGGGASGRPGDPGDGGDAVGSTTHISVLDAEGMAVSVTCSNGACSGVVVPGTGISLNNMLGETDLHPFGVDRAIGGQRITSMMAPTIVLEDGQPKVVLGSAGSNRIRSAILQVIVNVVDRGMGIKEAVEAPRIHFEDGTLQAEPGVDTEALGELAESGIPVVQWDRQNLFFGGCQAVGRDPGTGQLEGAGDPRRGGASVVV
jgi:gamma-glutamyltranspeptidase/glutathione hydrolase